MSALHCARATVSTRLAGASAIEVGQETIVSCRVKTVPEFTARSMVNVLTGDVSVLQDTLGSTASMVRVMS